MGIEATVYNSPGDEPNGEVDSVLLPLQKGHRYAKLSTWIGRIVPDATTNMTNRTDRTTDQRRTDMLRHHTYQGFASNTDTCWLSRQGFVFLFLAYLVFDSKRQKVAPPHVLSDPQLYMLSRYTAADARGSLSRVMI